MLEEYTRRGIFYLREMGSANGLGLEVKKNPGRETPVSGFLKISGYALSKKKAVTEIFWAWGLRGKGRSKGLFGGWPKRGPIF